MADTFGRITLEDKDGVPLVHLEWAGTMRKGKVRITPLPAVPAAERPGLVDRAQRVVDYFTGYTDPGYVTVGESYEVPRAGSFAWLLATCYNYGSGFGLFVDGTTVDWPGDPEALPQSEELAAADEAKAKGYGEDAAMRAAAIAEAEGTSGTTHED